MLANIFRLFLNFIISLGCASLLIFFVIEILPGDPASIMLGLEAREDTLANLRQAMGLDQPLMTRYWQWISGMFSGDFGTSLIYDVPVSGLIYERLQVTLPLTLYTMILTALIALPLGIQAALHHQRPQGKIIQFITQFTMAVPNFWLAIMMIFIFSLSLGLFDTGGFVPWIEAETGEWQFFKALHSLTLPAFALILPQAAILARITRAAMLEVIYQEYIRTATAKGTRRLQRIWFHALPNGLIIILTLIGLQFSFLLSGTVVIENLFHLPGLGRLLFQMVAQRDLISVKNIVMVMVASVIIVNILVSLLTQWIDPRLRVKMDKIDG